MDTNDPMVSVDVLVVGAGPAGLSAAVYASRAGLSTTILTGDTPGGLTTTTERIDNYLGMFGSAGGDMAENFLDHATKFGAVLVSDTAESVVVSRAGFFQTITSQGKVINSSTVVYAAGSNPRKLEIAGEDLNGVSYCATCDGLFYEGEHVVVVGGGETAVEDALYLSNIAAHVDVLVRGDSWRATAPAVKKLTDQDNVTVHMGTQVASIAGTEGNVTGVTTDTGVDLDATGVFIAVGQKPNSSVASPLVSLYEDGFIRSSKVKGFFVTGDVMNPTYRQVAIAVGEGAKAGMEVTAYLLSH